MGKVRPEHIKRIADELINRFPDKFSDEFEDNKQAVSMLTQGATPKVRNRIAGYITHVLAGTQASSQNEESGNGE